MRLAITLGVMTVFGVIGSRAATNSRQQGAQTRIDSLTWLSGCWERRGQRGVTEEQWARPAGGTMRALTLVADRKGLLAADETVSTLSRRLVARGIESTPDSRRAYREMLFSTPGIGECISGVILHEETIRQRTAKGRAFPSLLAQQGIVPGIKVDAGKVPLALAPDDEVTVGLDGLAQRLDGYKAQGARFAKWRAVYHVSDTLPSRLAVEANAHALARYAAICQAQGVVPIEIGRAHV